MLPGMRLLSTDGLHSTLALPREGGGNNLRIRFRVCAGGGVIWYHPNLPYAALSDMFSTTEG